MIDFLYICRFPNDEAVVLLMLQGFRAFTTNGGSLTLRSAVSRRYLLKRSVWDQRVSAVALCGVQVSMEVWAFPCLDADDDLDECDTSFTYDLFSQFQFSNVL